MKCTIPRVAAAAVTLWLISSARASDPTGIYALVDKVVLEPSETDPQRIQIWGAFASAQEKFGDQYFPPVRGYLYYSLPADKQNVARTEWGDLKRMAGTGQAVSFGSRHLPLGRVRTGKGPAGPTAQLDEKAIAQLILRLDDEQQTTRDRATEDLERLGTAADPALREALKHNPSPEGKARIERVLSGSQPDVYPLGWGMNRFRKNEGFEPVRALLMIPAAAIPADGDVVESARLTLVAGNVANKNSPVQYNFEIEDGLGNMEASPAIATGPAQTEWAPKMQIKPGGRYTWRVWASAGAYKGPVATATFRGK